MVADKILKFIETKPEVFDIIGYGSGVMEQAGYTEDINRQIDMIVTVSNCKKYHKENHKKNLEEYSKLGYYFSDFLSHLGTDINYISNIDYNDDTFKMGIIEQKDLIKDLNNWENFYIAGRMQKPIKIVKADDAVRKAILINRMNALKTALVFNHDKLITERELFETICSLSYIGDIRMYFKCENPNKIKNIVDGSFNEYIDMYTKANDNLYTTNNGIIIPNREKIISELNEMPKSLINGLGSLDGITINDLELLKNYFYKYLKSTNFKASTCQPIKSIVLNGTSKSINYLEEKIKKGKM